MSKCDLDIYGGSEITGAELLSMDAYINNKPLDLGYIKSITGGLLTGTIDEVIDGSPMLAEARTNMAGARGSNIGSLDLLLKLRRANDPKKGLSLMRMKESEQNSTVGAMIVNMFQRIDGMREAAPGNQLTNRIHNWYVQTVGETLLGKSYEFTTAKKFVQDVQKAIAKEEKKGSTKKTDILFDYVQGVGFGMKDNIIAFTKSVMPKDNKSINKDVIDITGKQITWEAIMSDVANDDYDSFMDLFGEIKNETITTNLERVGNLLGGKFKVGKRTTIKRIVEVMAGEKKGWLGRQAAAYMKSNGALLFAKYSFGVIGGAAVLTGALPMTMGLGASSLLLAALLGSEIRWRSRKTHIKNGYFHEEHVGKFMQKMYGEDTRPPTNPFDQAGMFAEHRKPTDKLHFIGRWMRNRYGSGRPGMGAMSDLLNGTSGEFFLYANPITASVTAQYLTELVADRNLTPEENIAALEELMQDESFMLRALGQIERQSKEIQGISFSESGRVDETANANDILNSFGGWGKAKFRAFIQDIFGGRLRSIAWTSLEHGNPEMVKLIRQQVGGNHAQAIAYLLMTWRHASRLVRILDGATGDDEDETEEESKFWYKAAQIRDMLGATFIPLQAFVSSPVYRPFYNLINYAVRGGNYFEYGDEVLKELSKTVDEVTGKPIDEKLLKASHLLGDMLKSITGNSTYLPQVAMNAITSAGEQIRSPDGKGWREDIIEGFGDFLTKSISGYDFYLTQMVSDMYQQGVRVPISPVGIFNMLLGEQQNPVKNKIRNTNSVMAWVNHFADEANDEGFVGAVHYAIQMMPIAKKFKRMGYVFGSGYEGESSLEKLIDFADKNKTVVEVMKDGNYENVSPEILIKFANSMMTVSNKEYVGTDELLRGYTRKDGKVIENDYNFRILEEKILTTLGDKDGKAFLKGMDNLVKSSFDNWRDPDWGEDAEAYTAEVFGFFKKNEEYFGKFPQVGPMILAELTSRTIDDMITRKYGYAGGGTKEQQNEIKAQVAKRYMPLLRLVDTAKYATTMQDIIQSVMTKEELAYFYDEKENDEGGTFLAVKRGINDGRYKQYIMAAGMSYNGRYDGDLMHTAWEASNREAYNLPEEQAIYLEMTKLMLVDKAMKEAGASDREYMNVIGAMIGNNKDLYAKFLSSDQFDPDVKDGVDSIMYNYSVLTEPQDDIEDPLDMANAYMKNQKGYKNIKNTTTIWKDDGDDDDDSPKVRDTYGRKKYTRPQYFNQIRDLYATNGKRRYASSKRNPNLYQSTKYNGREKKFMVARAYLFATKSHYPTYDRQFGVKGIRRTKNVVAPKLKLLESGGANVESAVRSIIKGAVSRVA